jgi:hypothetical protein
MINIGNILNKKELFQTLSDFEKTLLVLECSTNIIPISNEEIEVAYNEVLKIYIFFLSRRKNY